MHYNTPATAAHHTPCATRSTNSGRSRPNFITKGNCCHALEYRRLTVTSSVISRSASLQSAPLTNLGDQLSAGAGRNLQSANAQELNNVILPETSS